MTRTTSVNKPHDSSRSPIDEIYGAIPTRAEKPSKRTMRSARALSPDTTLESFLDFPIENQRALTNVLIQQRKALGKTQYQIAA